MFFGKDRTGTIIGNSTDIDYLEMRVKSLQRDVRNLQQVVEQLAEELDKDIVEKKGYYLEDKEE